MKTVIVTETIGRKAIHSYGHPIRLVKLDKPYINNSYASHRFKTLNSNNKPYNDDVYMAIYDTRKYKYMTRIHCNVISVFVMVVDDNMKEVYNYLSITRDSIPYSIFDSVFEKLGLKFKENQTNKEKRDALSKILNVPRFNALNYIVSYDSVVQSQFIDEHYDFLLENYLDSDAKVDGDLLCNIHIADGRLFDYIDKHHGKMNLDTIDRIIKILDKGIFKNGVFSMTGYIDDCIFTILEFIGMDLLPVVYILQTIKAYKLIDYVNLCWLLMGKPKFKNYDNIKNSNEHFLDNIEVEFLSRDIVETALKSINYKFYLDDILKNLNPDEMIGLFSYAKFEPITEVYREGNYNKRYLIKDDEIELYQRFMDIPSPRLKSLLKQRYVVPTEYTRKMIAFTNDFESTMFFVYMQGNYNNFLKDSELIVYILMHGSFTLQKILSALDCSKFVNEKVKKEFVRILLLELECRFSKEVLKDIMRDIRKSNSELCPELRDLILSSSHRKLKEVCNI